LLSDADAVAVAGLGSFLTEVDDDDKEVAAVKPDDDDGLTLLLLVSDDCTASPPCFLSLLKPDVEVAEEVANFSPGANLDE